jgi:hypothetical protein
MLDLVLSHSSEISNKSLIDSTSQQNMFMHSRESLETNYFFFLKKKRRWDAVKWRFGSFHFEGFFFFSFSSFCGETFVLGVVLLLEFGIRANALPLGMSVVDDLESVFLRKGKKG